MKQTTGSSEMIESLGTENLRYLGILEKNVSNKSKWKKKWINEINHGKFWNDWIIACEKKNKFFLKKRFFVSFSR